MSLYRSFHVEFVNGSFSPSVCYLFFCWDPSVCYLGFYVQIIHLYDWKMEAHRHQQQKEKKEKQTD